MIDRSTWGYRPDGRAAIFDDGVLPEGWSDRPSKDQHDALALTARMERNPRLSMPPRIPADEPAKAARKGRNG